MSVVWVVEPTDTNPDIASQVSDEQNLLLKEKKGFA
jgi:hypothetical protein